MLTSESSDAHPPCLPGGLCSPLPRASTTGSAPHLAVSSKFSTRSGTSAGHNVSVRSAALVTHARFAACSALAAGKPIQHPSYHQLAGELSPPLYHRGHFTTEGVALLALPRAVPRCEDKVLQGALHHFSSSSSLSIAHAAKVKHFLTEGCVCPPPRAASACQDNT